jgi:predicted  nucleic acid-binding Zn-ribbon protein
VTAAALASARSVLASLEASTASMQGDVRVCQGELSASEAEQQASQRAMEEAEANARQLRADIAQLEQQLAAKRAMLRDVESGMAGGGAMHRQLQLAQERVGLQRDLLSALQRQQREVDELVAEGRRLVESAAATVQQMQEMDEAMERAVSEVSEP